MVFNKLCISLELYSVRTCTEHETSMLTRAWDNQILEHTLLSNLKVETIIHITNYKVEICSGRSLLNKQKFYHKFLKGSFILKLMRNKNIFENL